MLTFAARRHPWQGAGDALDHRDMYTNSYIFARNFWDTYSVLFSLVLFITLQSIGIDRA
jgi:hypothetical protein